MGSLSQLYKQTYTIFRYNLVLVQPLILFFLVITLALSPVNAAPTGYGILLILGISVALIAAFLAGWFEMFKEAIQISTTEEFDQLDKLEKTRKTIFSFKAFFPGTGMHFFQILIGLLLYSAFAGAIGYNLWTYGAEHIGFPKVFTMEALYQLQQTVDPQKAYEEFINTLPLSDHFILARWTLLYLLFLLLILFINFFTIYWPQFVVLNNMNVVKAYFESFKLTIVHPFKSIIIAISYLFAMIVVWLLFALSNLVTIFLAMILYSLSIVFFTLLLFIFVKNAIKPIDTV